MFQRYIRTTSGANQIFSVCWIWVNICPRYYKDREECPCWGLILDLDVGKGTQSFVTGHLWYHRSHAAAAKDSSRWPSCWLFPVRLCGQGLTYRWCRWGLALLCTFCNLWGLPLGQPDVPEVFEAEGSLLEWSWWINQCHLPCWLCFYSRFLHPTVDFVWLAGSWCNCSLCAGFLLTDVLYLLLSCGRWPNSELNQS